MGLGETYMRKSYAVAAALLVSVATPLTLGAQAAADTTRTVLFVCEHGTVKSLLAKLLFERYATAAGLPVRAVSRGTQADSVVPGWMQQALGRDGLALGAWRPQALRAPDLASASYVVSFDVPRSATDAARSPRAQWDGMPSVSQDYAGGRAAIERRVRELVDSLARASERGRQ